MDIEQQYLHTMKQWVFRGVLVNDSLTAFLLQASLERKTVDMF